MSLSREYDRLRGAFGWTDAELTACNHAELDAAFLDEPTRARLRPLLDAGGAP